MGITMEKTFNKLIEKYENSPYENIDITQMAGDPPFHRPENQAVEFPQPVLTDIKDAARKLCFQLSQLVPM